MLAGTVALLVLASWNGAAGGATVGRTVLLVVALVSVGILPQALQRPDSTHLTWVTCVSWPFAVVAVADVVQRRWPRATMRRARRRGRRLHPRAHVRRDVTVHVPPLPAAHARRVRPGAASVRDQPRRSQLLLRRPARRSRQPAGRSTTSTASPAPATGCSSARRICRARGTAMPIFYWLFPEMEPATYFIEMDPGLANAEDSRLADDLATADFVILTGVLGRLARAQRLDGLRIAGTERGARRATSASTASTRTASSASTTAAAEHRHSSVLCTGVFAAGLSARSTPTAEHSNAMRYMECGARAAPEVAGNRHQRAHRRRDPDDPPAGPQRLDGGRRRPPRAWWRTAPARIPAVIFECTHPGRTIEHAAPQLRRARRRALGRTRRCPAFDAPYT